MTVKSGPVNRIQSIKQCYFKEFSFISNLLSSVDLSHQDFDSEDSDNEYKRKKAKMMHMKKGVDRAQTLEELHKRLAAIREQKYTFKGKRLKKRLQNKLKKKKKIYETKMKRNANSKEHFHETSGEEKKIEIKPPKPVFNSEGNLVFSKFDFLGETTSVNDKESLARDKGSKKQILEKLGKKQKFIKKLEETGETEKANYIKEEIAWSNVLKKSEGIKVKDDPNLLKKSLAKRKAQKKASEKKWKERIKTVEKQKIDRQKKRTENIMKRNQEKKKKKLKKATKKGRHIPNV